MPVQKSHIAEAGVYFLTFTNTDNLQMAKASSILRLEGTIGEITFYQRNGKWFARAKSSLTGEKVKSSERFKRSLENVTEFGAVSSIARQVWQTLPKNWKHFRDSYAFTRYKSILYQILTLSPGDRGKRQFQPALRSGIWKGFQFNNKKFFTSACRSDLPLSWSAATGRMALSLPATAEDLFLSPPDGATHARLTFAGLVLPPFAFDPAVKKWASVPEWQNTYFSHTGTDVPLQTGTAIPSQLVLSFPAQTLMPQGYTIQALLGISFYQEVQGALNLLPSKSAMMIANAWG